MDTALHARVRDLAARWDARPFIAAAVDDIVTPALVLDADAVEHNIRAVLASVGDPERWRPHVKTTKMAWTIERLLEHGVRRFKCATTLELQMLVDAGVPEALFAMTARGANARAVRELAQRGDTAVAVLVEGADDLDDWAGAPVGVFIDVDIGLGRTGVPVSEVDAIVGVARAAVDRGLAYEGLHAYEGTPPAASEEECRVVVGRGLDGVVAIVRALEAAGCAPREVVTSGSITASWAAGHPDLAAAAPHTISPGTVVYHDIHTELESPWGLDLRPAVAVLGRVVSSSRPGLITCDAGHKAVAADMGDPIGLAAGRPELSARTPSEEHLPLAVEDGAPRPERGEILAIVPMHVCPTVNLHDVALVVRDGAVEDVRPVSARGHQHPLPRAAQRA